MRAPRRIEVLSVRGGAVCVGKKLGDPAVLARLAIANPRAAALRRDTGFLDGFLLR